MFFEKNCRARKMWFIFSRPNYQTFQNFKKGFGKFVVVCSLNLIMSKKALGFGVYNFITENKFEFQNGALLKIFVVRLKADRSLMHYYF